jgi:hypothetical protein
MVAKYGTPALQARVRAAVHKRYPAIGGGGALSNAMKEG